MLCKYWIVEIDGCDGLINSHVVQKYVMGYYTTDAQASYAVGAPLSVSFLRNGLSVLEFCSIHSDSFLLMQILRDYL